LLLHLTASKSRKSSDRIGRKLLIAINQSE
jgi:hypothetical protein